MSPPPGAHIPLKATPKISLGITSSSEKCSMFGMPFVVLRVELALCYRRMGLATKGLDHIRRKCFLVGRRGMQ